MFNIHTLIKQKEVPSDEQLDEYQVIIQAVAQIETLVQPQQAWCYETIKGLLEQDSIDLLYISSNADCDIYNDDYSHSDDNRRIVGYCLYQTLFEQAEILRIGTHPQYQRQGVASCLLSALDKKLQYKGAQSLLLEVRANNKPAIMLYKQQGFEIIHTRKGYYKETHKPAIDALIMQRKIEV